MAATTVDRKTRQRIGGRRGFPMAAATSIPLGVLACLNSAGYLVNASTSATLKCVGVPIQAALNNPGSAGDVVGEVDKGVFGPFANSASGDQITLADVGSLCYLVDNQTLAKTHNTNARSPAGIVDDVTSEGVWVEIR